jgi:hypothetical protein
MPNLPQGVHLLKRRLQDGSHRACLTWVSIRSRESRCAPRGLRELLHMLDGRVPRSYEPPETPRAGVLTPARLPLAGKPSDPPAFVHVESDDPGKALALVLAAFC